MQSKIKHQLSPIFTGDMWMTFMIFKHKPFLNFMKKQHKNIQFTFENEINDEIPLP